MEFGGGFAGDSDGLGGICKAWGGDGEGVVAKRDGGDAEGAVGRGGEGEGEVGMGGSEGDFGSRDGAVLGVVHDAADGSVAYAEGKGGGVCGEKGKEQGNAAHRGILWPEWAGFAGWILRGQGEELMQGGREGRACGGNGRVRCGSQPQPARGG